MTQRQNKSPEPVEQAEPELEIVTVVSQAMRIAGQIHGQEDIRVFGTLEGSVMLSGGSLHIEKTGVVLADVQAESVFVSGIVVGDLIAQDRVVLRADARVVGDISTQRLVIEPGAAVRGNLATAESSATGRDRSAAAEASATNARSNGARRVLRTDELAKAPKRRIQKPVSKSVVHATDHATDRIVDRITTAIAPPKKSNKVADKKKAARPRVPARGKHRVAST
jgi:cytoskeletal protein CcmA (bactofilin family)